MELDKRIKAITDIQSVTNGCHDWGFMTKKGYFANSIFDFKDLKRTCVYGEYAGWREHNQCFLCEQAGDKAYFSYFLPEDSLLPEEKPEKKYRPYTLAEWIAQHEIGEVINYKDKSEKGLVAHHMYMGYAHGIDKNIKDVGVGVITLGVASYDLDYLFKEYEIEVDGEWKPFGVLDEEKE